MVKGLNDAGLDLVVNSEVGLFKAASYPHAVPSSVVQAASRRQ